MYRYSAVRTILSATLALVLFTGCATSRPELSSRASDGYVSSAVSADSIVAALPDYSTSLQTVKGKGKAFISEPGNTNRATLLFESNREKSLITARNSIGIEGGQLLTDGDSLLVYNKVDDYARILSIKDTQLQSINNLASINLLDILHTAVKANAVENVRQNNDTFLLQLKNGGDVYVSRKNMRVQQIDQPRESGLPYARILYDGYVDIDGLSLPRKITIFSADQSAKVDLLIQSLDVNPDIGALSIELPDDIKIYRQ